MNEDELAELLESERRSDGAGRPDDGPAGVLRDLLSDEATWVEPPPGGADALLAAIRAEQAGAAPAGPRAAGPRGARPIGAGPGSGGAGRGRARRWRVLAVAAAAAVAVVAGVVAVALRASEGGGGREVALSRGPAAAELAPDVSGDVTVTETGSGVDIVLDVHGLPPAPPGAYYQGWVKGPDGLVTIGTFHMRGGDDTVTLWSGVDVDRYPTLTVTLQREGAGAESSGQVVLQAQIGP